MNYNELLSKSKAGDTAARDRLLQLLQVRLRLVLKYRLWRWPSEDHEDILQDTMEVMTRQLKEVESNPDLYALGVLRSKIGNALSRRHRRSEVSVSPTGGVSREEKDELGPSTDLVLSEADVGFAVVEDADVVEAVRRAIRRLSPRCQALFLAILEKRTVAETWESLSSKESLSRSAFDKRLFDCRRKLRHLMKDSL